MESIYLPRVRNGIEEMASNLRLLTRIINNGINVAMAFCTSDKQDETPPPRTDTPSGQEIKENSSGQPG